MVTGTRDAADQNSEGRPVDKDPGHLVNSLLSSIKVNVKQKTISHGKCKRSHAGRLNGRVEESQRLKCVINHNARDSYNSLANALYRTK